MTRGEKDAATIISQDCWIVMLAVGVNVAVLGLLGLSPAEAAVAPDFTSFTAQDWPCFNPSPAVISSLK